MVSAGVILEDSLHWLRGGLVVASPIVIWMICFIAINKAFELLYKAKHKKSYAGSAHSDLAMILATGVTVVVAWGVWNIFRWHL